MQEDEMISNIIQRTKQRREMLAKKLTDTPDPVVRKRRTPLVEDDTNSVPETAADDDSPKRHCMREKLAEIKPDTPAISSVRSRMTALAGQRGQWSSESGEEYDNCPVPPREAFDPPQAEVPLSNPPSRKNRLANLAQTINCWEDDLSHPVIVKEEPKKPKWQPPNKPCHSEDQENIPRQRDRAPSGQHNKGRAPSPPKQPSTKYQAPCAPPLPSSPITKDKAANMHAGKSPRHLKSAPAVPTVLVSPAKPVRYEIRQNVNQVPINEQELRRSPTSGEETDEPTRKPVTARMAKWAEKATGEQKPLDPAQQPISARFAKWEERVSQTPTKPLPTKAPQFNTPKHSIVSQKFSSASKASAAPSPATKFTGGKTCSSETKAKAKTRESVDPASKPVSERMAKWKKTVAGDKTEPQEDEPTAYSVTARMSAWEHMSSSQKVSHVKKVEPGTSPAKTPTKTVSSPVSKPPTSAGKKVTPVRNVTAKSAAVKPTLKPQKSFAESILEKASEIRSPSATIEKPPRARVPSSKSITPQKTNEPSHDDQESEKTNTLSPSNASCAMKTIQQRLMEQTNHSTQSQTMAERLRQERLQELANIQNRWQNGILKEDNSDSDHVEPNKDHSPPKMQRLSDIVNPKDEKKEAIHAKARADFEGKLASMGFDVSNENQRMASVSFRKSRRNDVTGSTSSQESGEERPRLLTGRKATPPAPPTPQQLSLPSRKCGSQQVAQQAGGSLLQLVRKGSNSKSQPPLMKPRFDDGFDSDGGESTTSSRRKSQASIDSDIVDTQDETDQGESAGNYGSTEGLDSLDADSSFEHFQGKLRENIDEGDDVSLSAFVPASVRRQSVLPNADNPQYCQSLTSQSSSEDLQPELPHRSENNDRYVFHRSEINVKHLMQNENNACSTTSLNSNASTNSETSIGETYESRRKYYESEGTETEEDDSRQEMGDYLDEAIDEDQPVPAPRKRRSHMMATNNGGAAAESDCPLMYSVSMYRSKRYARDKRPPPKMVIKRSEAPQDVEEEQFDMPTVTHFSAQSQKQSIHEKIKELTELANQELSVIKQTSNALNQCCMGNSSFAGSAEQAECNRLLLISSQRRMAYMSEIQRLKDEKRLEAGSGGPKGSLTISEMRLPLKREFVTKLGTANDSAVHYFIILIRNGFRVIVTEMLSTHDERIRGSLDFPNHINLNDISGDFQVQLELYGMSIVRETSLKDKKKGKTPKKKKDFRAVQSPGGPNAVMTSSFKLIAVLPITMKSVDKACFNLDKVPYVSPIFGTIYLRLKCTKEANVQERGFLTMFEDVSGLGAWHRRWCVLSANKICYWKYPDDEGKKEPMGFIDLKRCITEKVGVIPRDICARQHTFELITVRQPRKGEQDTLVSKTYSTMTTMKHMLSADTKEERILWCNKINRALVNIRTWHSDAARPIKPQRK